MAELTKERLEHLLSGANKNSTMMYSGVSHCEFYEMARHLLAGMEQEPVGEVVLGDYDDCGDYPDAKVVCIAAQGQADWNNFSNGTKLYAAPQLPHPAVPDENGLLPCPFCGSPAEHYPDGDMEGYSVMCGHKNGDCDSWIFGFATPEEAERSWNTRAAMLQGAEQPQNAPQNIPENIPTLREGLAAIRNLGPIDAEKIQEERDALKTLDVPDGWVLVPIEPTEDMVIAGFEAELRKKFRDPEAWEAFEAMSGCEQAAHRAKLCWAAMIAAAPQQEVKLALAEGMARYGDAMQKLADSGD